MSHIARMLILVLVVIGTAGALQTAEAQLLKRLKDRAKDKVEEKVGEKQDRAIDRALDGEGEYEESEDAPAVREEAEASPAATASMKPGEGAWANYDFVPGERPLFVDDFSADNVGDFPRRLEFLSGNMEIVDWNGGRWLRAEGGEFYINLPEELPERFTFEFELAGSGNPGDIRFSHDEQSYDHYVSFDEGEAWVKSGAVDGNGSFGSANTNEAPVKIRIAMDGKYIKLYANEKRALNVPNADLGRSNRIYVHLNGWSAEDPRLIANIRVMAGGRKLYDALAAEGRVVTQGILFDTGSDRLRPESTPTLKEIGQMLKEHADLRIRVEGHTDNVGSADLNKALSEKRAAAVKDFIVSAYGVDGGRVETAGFGPDQPAAPNDTPEGRQTNRRVELVKL